MNSTSLPVFLFALLLMNLGCTTSTPEKSIEVPSSRLLQMMEHSIGFYNQHAYDPHLKVYFSEIDHTGNRTSDRVHLVALSRLVYALSYGSSYQEAHLIRAQEAGQFILTEMMRSDSLGPYFLETVVPEAPTSEPTDLGMWQQSYGICGLTELYRATQDSTLLASLRDIFEAYVIRFRDPQSGGFCGRYHMGRGPVREEKSLPSLLYPVSAAMVNLWEADVAGRKRYEPFLQEHIDLLLEKAWDEESGWINPAFDANWEILPADSSSQVSPGHNFQLAWNLLRASSWPFLSAPKQKACKELGEKILARTLALPIWDKGPAGGFFQSFSPLTGAALSPLKSWWQHTEALIALSFVGPTYTSEFQQLFEFYEGHFLDMTYGGESFYLQADNQPLQTEGKGSMGKSSYHVTEMVRFLIQNQVALPD